LPQIIKEHRLIIIEGTILHQIIMRVKLEDLGEQGQLLELLVLMRKAVLMIHLWIQINKEIKGIL
jgi:hypothetical protein